ncbi:hypothetical protein GCM10010492_58320 [Saccharothrix mutabilis subsp. mutabilis]|uniref:HTH tetR-type domain-containing protein n=1 Tax=Saccharothrix mutabilis subsp. mutabilis TaxID=66855 RepID=A0ABN0UH65_9PSEU
MSPTPERILASARALFAERGYRATSMQAIADRVGITKAALYHHFAAKDDLLRHLTLPLLDELEAALGEAEAGGDPEAGGEAEAGGDPKAGGDPEAGGDPKAAGDPKAGGHPEAGGDPEAVRWRAIEGYVDVYLRHRETLLMLVRDMTLLVQAPVADRFRAAVALANDLVCGPDRSLAGRVRAAQVVAGLGDPVVLFLDVPPDRLKRLILDGARALLAETPVADGPPGPAPVDPAGGRPRGRPRGRGGGRPAALSEPEAGRARELYAAGRPVAEIAERLGVSRATVYRSLKSPG